MYVGRKRHAEPLPGAVRFVFLLRHSPCQRNTGAKYGRSLYFSYHVHHDLLSGEQMSERQGLSDVCV